MPTTRPAKRFVFVEADVTTVATEAEAEDAQRKVEAQETELDELEAEIKKLGGARINHERSYVRTIFEGLQADDDQPLEIQLTRARQVRDELKAKQGASSATLPQAEQEVLALFREGHLRIFTRQIDNPDKPGEMVAIKAVIDNRLSRRPRPAQQQTPPAPVPIPVPVSPSSGAPAQSVTTPVTPPPSNPAPVLPSPVVVDPVASSDSSTGVPAGDDGSDPDPADTVDSPKKEGLVSRIWRGTRSVVKDLASEDPQPAPTTPPSSDPAQPQPNTQ